MRATLTNSTHLFSKNVLQIFSGGFFVSLGGEDLYISDLKRFIV